jgi:mannose-6-phosphate isomerase-like protein (cupin superfamily)
VNRYTVADVDALPGEGPGGMVRKVRRALGTQAFGCNYFTLPPHSEGREHDHARSGQEEVYFVVRGSGRMRIEDAEVELRPGRFIRVDAAATRSPIAGADGLEFLAIGAPLGGGYEPPAWG